MNVNLELDGEPISIEQASPSDRTTGLNVREDFPTFNDSFNNYDGMINHADSEGRIKMIAAVAGQNTPNYFDQDNFYPADGIRGIGQSITGNLQNFFSSEEAKARQQGRKARRDTRTGAKADERKSRADLNRAAGQEKQSDIELAKALGKSDAQPMSTTTKVLIGVGVVAVLGAIAYFVMNKKK
jgi:hypothetical protein